MTYEEAEAYILEIPKFTKKNEPSHTKEFLGYLGNPQDRFAYIHVAGSNGKGSVCAYLTHVLLESGIRVGSFTSPHLIDLRERFCIGGELCSRQQFLESFEQVRQAVSRMQAAGLAHPTFFEYIYAMAMVLFAREGVSCAVVETGLGGRLDATNIRKCPTLTVITSISLEHTEILGDTIEQIAAEKAGIIKAGVPVVFDGNDKAAAQVIRQRAEALGAPVAEITKESINILLKTGKKIDFSLDCRYDVTRVEISATAPYQVMNGALALAAVNELGKLPGTAAGLGDLPGVEDELGDLPGVEDELGDLPGVEDELGDLPGAAAGLQKPAASCFACLTAETIARGFEKAFWPGRMEEALPEVYLDGAHNVAGIQAFLEAARELAKEPAILLFSMVREKDYGKVITLLCETGLWEEIILTEIPDNGRALKLEALQAEFRGRASGRERLTAIREVGEALRVGLVHKKKGQKLFCVGSLYLIGSLKQELILK